MAGGSGYRGRGPRLDLLDHDRGGGSSRPGLPGHPPGQGHPPAGSSPPPPRQGHGPTAPGGAPLPQAAARHRGGTDLPGGSIQAAQGPLREVLRWLARPAQGPGVMPRAVQQAWAALQRRLDRLRALGPEYADFEPGGAPGRLAPLASLSRLSAALAGNVRATLRAEDKDRVRE